VKSPPHPLVPGHLCILLLLTIGLAPVDGGAAELKKADALRPGSAEALRKAALTKQAESWTRIAEDRQKRRDLKGAVKAYQAAVVRYRKAGQQEMEVEALNSEGRSLRLLGKLDAAKIVDSRALAVARQAGFLPGEAVALNNLGMIGYFTGESDQALPAFRSALAIWLQIGDRARAATTLNNIGSTYLLAGRIDDASYFFQRSLTLAQAAGERNAEATALTELGWANYLRQEYSQAIELYGKAIKIRRADGDPLGEAGALDRLGSAFRELGQTKRAEHAYRRALGLLQAGGSQLDEAHTLSNLCQLGLATGSPTAGPNCERALTLFRQGGDLNGQAHALYLQARLLERNRKLQEAVRVNGKALDVLDSLWMRAEGSQLRTSYLETRQIYFEFHLSILMALHDRYPARGFDTLALQASERARSRNLLEALLESRQTHKQHSALIEALSRGRSLDIRRLRSHVLTADTLILVYSVGDQASFLWWISRDTMGSARLPGRRQLESSISKVRGLLADRKTDPVQTFLALDSLGGNLLGPDSAMKKYSRWIVIPDGPLHYVPFGSLSLRQEREGNGASATEFLASWRPLLARHEITTAPSLSVLELLQEPHQAGDKTLAVFADPVFSFSDPRISGGVHPTGRDERVTATSEPPVPGSLADLQRSAQKFQLQGWPRLPGSRAEALHIQSMVAPSKRFVAFDFAASRQAALKREMSRYRILHFATHSLLNERNPELSAIVLSLVDENGRPVDGFLRSTDVLRLRLSAELVVLSGCRTALGKESRGEGLVGLTQAFLIAGARGLLVTLWDVDDRATSELMERFYDNLFKRKLTPAAALRQAQMSLLAETRWRSPYYWGAFALIGEGGRHAFSPVSLNNP
jgi:CHAT domain-containing protein/Tfp pilus assembly protein PilF